MVTTLGHSYPDHAPAPAAVVPPAHPGAARRTDGARRQRVPGANHRHRRFDARLRVSVERKDYQGPISLDLRNLPAKTEASKAVIARGQDSVEVDSAPAPTTKVSLYEDGGGYVLIRGDAQVSPALLPLENLNVNANGVMLQHLNLGTVTIGAGFSGAVITDSAVHSIAETGGLTGNGNNTITFDRITGSVTLVGNTTTGTSDVVVNDQFTGTATTMLSLTNDGGALIQNNSFVGGANGQAAISILDTAAITLGNTVIANNTINLPGTTLNTSGIWSLGPATTRTRRSSSRATTSTTMPSAWSTPAPAERPLPRTSAAAPRAAPATTTSAASPTLPRRPTPPSSSTARPQPRC